jgi:hypothetical protein
MDSARQSPRTHARLLIRQWTLHDQSMPRTGARLLIRLQTLHDQSPRTDARLLFVKQQQPVSIPLFGRFVDASLLFIAPHALVLHVCSTAKGTPHRVCRCVQLPFLPRVQIPSDSPKVEWL